MNHRRTIITLSAVTALGLALLPGSAVSQQKSLKDQIVGTWITVSYEQTLPNGNKFQQYGPNPKGIEVYDANGHFSLIHMRPDLPKIASNNPLSTTPEEAKAIVAGSFALFGTYAVDEAKKTFTSRFEDSTFTNLAGNVSTNTVISITADELKYSFEAAGGGQIVSTLRRAK